MPASSAAELYQGDIKSVLLSEETIQARVSELGQVVGDEYRERIGEDGADLLLVTVLKGAVMFVSDLARAIPVPTQMRRGWRPTPRGGWSSGCATAGR